MLRMFGILARVFVVMILLAPVEASSQVVNGSFESGHGCCDIPGWGQWYDYAVYPSRGSGFTTPVVGYNISNPPLDGSYQAFFENEGSGTAVLWQDIAVPANAIDAVISFLYWNWCPEGWLGGNTLDAAAGSVRVSRIDIMDPSAGITSTTAGVLENVYLASSGTGISSWQQFVVDLMPYAGQTVRLRFAECVGTTAVGTALTGIDAVRPFFTTPQFTEIPLNLATRFYAAVDWGDVDGDGDFDIVSATDNNTFVYLNEGGSFSGAAATFSGFAKSAHLADFSNDNALDVALGKSGTSEVWIQQGGAFPELRPVAPADNPSNPGVLSGDFFNTGQTDLWVTGAGGGDVMQQVTPFLSEVAGWGPVGSFHDSQIRCFYVGFNSEMDRGDTAADFDGDGDLDLLFTGSGTWDASTGLLAGTMLNLTFGPNACVSNIGNTFTGVWYSAVAAGDTDGDGDVDLIVGGDSHPSLTYAVPSLATYVNDGAGNFTKQTWTTGVSDAGLGLGDVTNDGWLDVVVAGGVPSSSGSSAVTGMKVFRNLRNTAGFIDDTNLMLPDPWFQTSTVLGDFDGDNDLDILVAGRRRDSGYEKISIYRNDTAVTNTPPTAPGNLAMTGTPDGTMTFNWSAATDGQTPAAALTYNLRIGTTPGGSEIMSATANSQTGRRYTSGRGNVGQALSYTVAVNRPDAWAIYWSVQAVDNSYIGGPFAAEESWTHPLSGVDDAVPGAIARLGAAVPNPFNPATTVSFTLGSPERARLEIYDPSGRHVATLVDEALAAGEHAVTWFGLDDSGRRVGSGSYLYRLETGSQVLTRKMTLLK